MIKGRERLFRPDCSFMKGQFRIGLIPKTPPGSSPSRRGISRRRVGLSLPVVAPAKQVPDCISGFVLQMLLYNRFDNGLVGLDRWVAIESGDAQRDHHSAIVARKCIGGLAGDDRGYRIFKSSGKQEGNLKVNFVAL